MKENNYIVQSDAMNSEGNAIEMKLHLMLNSGGEWTLINADGETSDENIAVLQAQVAPIATYFQSVNDGIVSELILTVVIEQERIIQLQEIDPNGTMPGFVNRNETAIANGTVDYAQSLV